MIDQKTMIAFREELEKDAAAPIIAAAAKAAPMLARSAGVIGRKLLGRFGRKALGVSQRKGMSKVLLGKGGIGIRQRAGRTLKGMGTAAATTGAIGAGGVGIGAFTQPAPLQPRMLR